MERSAHVLTRHVAIEYSDSDSDEAREVLVESCIALQMRHIVSNRAQRRRGGSRIGRKPNREIGRNIGATNIDADYFARPSSIHRPIFFEEGFERRMRMLREVFENIRSGLLRSAYFTRRRDATEKPGASTDKKMLAALLQLTDGISESSTTRLLLRPAS
jgi:hypothetical protein